MFIKQSQMRPVSMQLWTWSLTLGAVSLPIATLGMSSQFPTFLALPTNCLFLDQGPRHRQGQVQTHTQQQVATEVQLKPCKCPFVSRSTALIAIESTKKYQSGEKS